MQSKAKHVAILGTGGTIAGVADDASRPGRYRAAALSVDALVAAVPALASLSLQTEQMAQVDSKDMSFATWHALAERVAHLLADATIAGIVITHGTDTLEETAYFLQRVLAPAKPVVLTAAMRPATDPQADGPRNLLDAVAVAQLHGARGVLVVMAGAVFAGTEVRKANTQRLDAFDAGGRGVIARVVDGDVQTLREWPDGAALGIDRLPRDDDGWPWVEIVQSGAGASGAAVRALCRAGVRGIVVAGTGNGSLHVDLLDALKQAQADGLAVLRCSRCATGAVTARDDLPFDTAEESTPAQARVELMLRLLTKPLQGVPLDEPSAD
jgi:L-asparaginase